MSNMLPARINYEDWGEAMLPNGLTLRYRAVLAMVLDDGDNKWNFRMQPQFQVYAPESQRRPTHPMTKKLMRIDSVILQGEAHSSYEVEGKTIHLRMKLERIFRTDGFDQNGDPVLNIDHKFEMAMHGVEPAPPQAASV